jgi:hypothetical protein
MDAVLICYCSSQIFQHCHIFKEFNIFILWFCTALCWQDMNIYQFLVSSVYLETMCATCCFFLYGTVRTCSPSKVTSCWCILQPCVRFHLLETKKLTFFKQTKHCGRVVSGFPQSFMTSFRIVPKSRWYCAVYEGVPDDRWVVNWKGCGRKQPWPSLRHCPDICVKRLRKTTKNLSQNSWSPGRGLNMGSP